MIFTEKKAVAYIRVSTDEQVRNGVSLVAQAASIKEWAEKAHVRLIQSFEDAGVSGTGIRHRHGLQEALRLSCEEQAVLVVYSLSRLSRCTKDTLQIAERLDRAGADLVSLSEQLDTTSASGKMIFRLMAVLNEFERDQVSERTKAALNHKKRNGMVYSPVPYGFKRKGNRLLPVEEEQRVIKLMHDFRGQGKSFMWIANTLAKMGFPTKNGGKWYPATVRGILMNSLHNTC